jgi:hypothetical protein
MPSRPVPIRFRSVLAAAAAVATATLGLLAALSSVAQGQPVQPDMRRLEISVDMQRRAGTLLGAERGRGRLTQQLVLSAVLHGDGVASSHNPLDPADGQRQLARAQQQQHAVRSALQRRGGAAATAMPDVQALQARAQQMPTRCGNDRGCLMREASALSAAQVAGGDHNLQARLQAYGAAVQACERSGAAGPAREACIANVRRQAGASDQTDQDDVVETPYLHFSGRAGCRFDVAVKIDDRVEGRFEDVQGTVPYVQMTRAEQRRRDDSACALVQVVLDTRDGRLWTHIGDALREVPGVTVRSEKGRAPQRHEGPVALQWLEGSDWLQQRLLKLSSGGEDQARLPAGVAGHVDGQLEMKLRWRFVPV